MNLEDLLRRRREDILERWRRLIVESYPSETARFLQGEQDRFANPVGHFIRSGTATVLDELLDGMDRRVICETLDPIVRTRAVQDFGPGDALRFVFDLKRVMADVAQDAGRPGGETGELDDVYARIDTLALMAFDTYTSCRDKLMEIRVDSIKRQYAVMLKRMNMLGVSPDPQEPLEEGEA
jgi:hypothetical protein